MLYMLARIACPCRLKQNVDFADLDREHRELQGLPLQRKIVIGLRSGAEFEISEKASRVSRSEGKNGISNIACIL